MKLKTDDILRYVDKEGCVEIGSGVWLSSQEDIMADQQGWDEEDGYKDYDFTDAPYWINTSDGQVEAITDGKDMAKALRWELDGKFLNVPDKDTLTRQESAFVSKVQSFAQEREAQDRGDMLKAVFGRDMSPEAIQDRVTAYQEHLDIYNEAMKPESLRETAKAQDAYERGHTHPNEFGGAAVKTAQVEESPADKLRDLRQEHEDGLRVLREDGEFLHGIVNKHDDYKVVNSVLNDRGSVLENEERAERFDDVRLAREDGQVRKLLEDTAPERDDSGGRGGSSSSGSSSPTRVHDEDKGRGDGDEDGGTGGGKPRLAKSLAAATGKGR